MYTSNNFQSSGIQKIAEPPPSPPAMAFVPVKFSRPQLVPPLFCSRRIYVHLAFLIVIIIILGLIRLMSQVKVTFVEYHLKSDSDAELVTLPKRFASARGAYCLDGSPPAFYLRNSPSPSVKFWIIYLPGGAWCLTEEECLQRSHTDLGSSHVARTSMPLDGLLSNNCEINPDFCYWNVVVLQYCDGSSFLGNQSLVLGNESKPLYLRGAIVFDTLIEYLISTTHLGSAEQILLAGSSAGGVGAFIHVDRLRTRLPQTVKTLHVLVDAAMFVNTADINEGFTLAHMFQKLYSLHSLKDSESIRECTTVQTSDNEWTCLLPGVYNQFVFTPAFFINSMYDTWQRRNILKIVCDADSCPEKYLPTIYATRDAIHNLAGSITKSKKNGAFLTVCPRHTIVIRPWFFNLEIGGLSLLNSIALWLQHHEATTSYDVVDLQSALEQCQDILK